MDEVGRESQEDRPGGREDDKEVREGRTWNRRRERKDQSER
jgi:hypothetical protein